MKKQLALLVLIIACSRLSAQSIAVALEDWKTAQGTQNFFYKNVIQTDDDDNVIVAGATLNNGFPDILVAKYNSSGNLLWTRQIAGTAPNGVDFAAGMTVTNTDIYITGAISNNSVTPETDVYTAKLSSATGSVVWSKTYDLAGAHDTGKELFVNGSGDVFVAGSGYNSSMNADFVMLRYNGSTGVQSWANSWGHSSGLDDGATKIRSNGLNVTVTGAVTNAANQYKAATLNISQSTGAVLTSTIGAAITTTSVDAVTDMAIDAAGNVIIAGGQYVSGQGHNFYVQKFNGTTLSSVFTYTWNGAASLDDMPKAVATDASNNVLVAGFSNSSTLGRELSLIKLNSSGSFQWLQQSGFSNDDEATDLVIDDNNEVYVTGYRTATTKNYYTAKYDASGTKIWETEMDGSSSLADYATNMALDSSNNVIVTGQSEISPGSYEFVTVKYVPKEVITPTDANNETPAANFMYYRNSGQLTAADSLLSPVPEVKFYTNNTAPAFYFRETGHSFVFARIDTSAATGDTLHRIDLDFYKSNPATGTYAMETQENGYLNYFLAHTSPRGIANVKGKRRLITPDLYENIDLMCSSNQNGIKYYFIVKPGGDPNDIKMDFTGASSYSLNGGSNVLSINSSIGSLSFDRPMAYQLTAANATVAVTGWTPDWQINGANNKYKFNTGAYTASLTLVIEVDQGNAPVSTSANKNLTWCTYYGGNSDDEFYDIKSNSSNSVWVTGYTYSTNFPLVNGYSMTNAGNRDAIFVKFNASGIRQWATYIGGSLDDGNFNRHGIDVDNSGNCFSAFTTGSTDFPMNNSGLINAYFDNVNSTPLSSFPQDVAIISLNNNGQLIWSTYFGGDGASARSYDIGLDGNNNLFVTGLDAGIPLINPSGSYQSPFALTSGGAYFIAKFSPTHQLLWSSYFGGNGPTIEKIAFTSSNDIIMVGSVDNATGADFDAVDPGSGAYFVNTFNGMDYDGFIAKFDGITNDLVWSTLYGGNGNDYVHAVTVDNGNAIYITGETVSTTGLISGNSLGYSDTTYNGAGTFFSLATGDGFLAKFNSSSQLVSSTYFGGAANEGAFDITYNNNRLFIPYATAGDDMPFYSGNSPNVFVQSNNTDGQDVSSDGYFASMDKNFNFLWSSYFGGTTTTASNNFYKQDSPFSNIVTGDNKYYVVGSTCSSSNFPIIGLTGAYNQSNPASATSDGFIAQFDLSLVPVSTLPSINKEDQLQLFPNPASDHTYINFKTREKYSILIYDIMGKKASEIESQSDMTKIDVSTFPKGAYIVKVITKINTLVGKLIVQ